MTVEALCAEYIERVEKGLILTRRRAAKSESTIATDRGRIARHIVPLLGSRTGRGSHISARSRLRPRPDCRQDGQERA